MNILQTLTIKNLKLNKKRTIVTIIGIMLATALIVALSSLVFSFRASVIEREKTVSGDYHYEFYNVPKDEIKYITNNRNVEKAYMTKDIGYSKLENSKNEYKPYLHLQGFSKGALDNLGIRLINGRMPENENEILISKHIKTNARVTFNIGDTITLKIGDRVCIDEQTGEKYELTQNNPYNGNDTKYEEYIEEKFTKTYTIVGIIERPSIEIYSAPGYTIITCLDENTIEENANVFVRYNKDGLKNYHKTTAEILGIEEKNLIAYETGVFEIKETIKYDFYRNSYLIQYETMDLSASFMTTLYSVSAIIIAIIILTSIFCIKNSFSISITEKVKQYGMLSSVGATSKQIKKNVYFESLVLATIGIPLGIGLGLLASFVLINICNLLLKETFEFNLVYRFSIIAILISLILSIITCLLSARSSAKKASKIAPIDAIRESEDIKVKSKKIKSPKFIKKLFGIGGDIAYKSLKRNKKKYRTTIVSIVVCVAVFIATSSFVDMAFKTVKIEMQEQDYNISLRGNSKEIDNLLEKLEAISTFDNINKCTIQRETMINTSSLKYSNEFKEYRGFNDSNISSYITVYSIGKDEYKRYINELKLNYDECKNKAILINTTIEYKYDAKGNSKKAEMKMYDCKKGDIINGKYILNENIHNISEDNISIEIADVVDSRPMGMKGLYPGDGILIVSDEFMDAHKEYARNYISMGIDSSNPDKLQDDIDEYLKSETGYSLYNVSKDMKSMQSMFLLISIFLYGFIIVIALIGITSIFNTITTSMELRSKEFAMLKSVGMTKKEFNKMVRLESVFYGTKSLLIGIPIGMGLSYLIFKALNGSVEFEYILPINGIMISIIAVFLLVWSIMKFSLNKINKQNIIETIRRDNI